MKSNRALILFDGFCQLCNGTVRFLIKRDKKNMFQYEALQSEKGKQVLKENNVPDEDTVVLVYKNSVYTRSDAFIEIFRLLPSPWNWLSLTKYLPKYWRDFGYDVIAKNRFRWFGKMNSCPTKYN